MPTKSTKESLLYGNIHVVGGIELLGTGFWKHVSVAYLTCLLYPQAIAVNAAESLNLNSPARTVLVPTSVTTPLVVRNGTQNLTVSAGSRLTPAQWVAAQQVMSTGQQSIQLSSVGTATGGTFIVPSSSNYTSIMVPRNVTAIGDFSTGSVLNVSGRVVNFGTIYAVSNNDVANNAIISSASIQNSLNATITSVLPVGGITGFSNAIANLNLTLLATNQIVNAGSISSAGTLNLVAGTQIVNNQNALITSSGMTNIVTPFLSNSGVIRSVNDINIAGNLSYVTELGALSTLIIAGNNLGSVLAKTNNLSIVNTGGLIESISSSIKVVHTNAIKHDSVNVSGGSWLTSELNADAGHGDLVVSLDYLSGVLNLRAGTVAAGAKSGNLEIGSSTIYGDPTFWLQGGGTLTPGSLSPGAALTLLSEGSINLASDTFSTTTAMGNGAPLTIIAGVKLFPSQGATSPLLTKQSVKASGPSSFGGDINCAGCTLDTQATVTSQKGGNILIAAYGTGGLGNINLGSSVIKTGTANTGIKIGVAGNITMIAPGAITIGNVNMVSPSPINRPTMVVANGLPIGSITAFSSGTVSGRLSSGSTTGAGTIDLQGVVTAPGGIISWQAGGKGLSINSSILTDGFAAPLDGRNGGRISLRSNGDLTVSGILSTVGSSGVDGKTSINPTIPGGRGGTGGNGGSILLSAENLLSLNGFILSKGGNGGTGGDGGSGSSAHIDSSNGGTGGRGGAGGSISLKAPTIDLGISIVTSQGGQGGAGGSGGIASVSNAGLGGRAGSGGSGGIGGTAGRQVHSATVSLGVGELDAFGGDGGVGGQAGVAGAGSNNPGGIGGASGSGGSAGRGSPIVVTTSGALFINGSVLANGGKGGDSQPGGTGGDGKTGGRGGSSGRGGNGASGAAISLLGGSITFPSGALSNISSAGGSGGKASNAGSGGAGTTSSSGSGGTGGNGGSGSSAAPLSLRATDADITVQPGANIFLSCIGGNGGSAGSGGTGKSASAGSGGSGGSGGKGGNGGNAAPISVNAPGSITLSGFGIKSRGGDGQDGGAGGDAGFSSTGIGGSSGNGGNGGNAGKGSPIFVIAEANLYSGMGFDSSGGFGGHGGSGGSASAGISRLSGGRGGTGGSGGIGAPASSIRVEARTGALIAGDLTSNGGGSGGGGIGGAGGHSTNGPGGRGGDGGNSPQGTGIGGNLTIIAALAVSIEHSLSTTSGGGSVGGEGGAGGDGTVGGDGGNGGIVFGSGYPSGNILVLGNSIEFSNSMDISTGGTTSLTSGSGGSGGAGSRGNGGNGGSSAPSFLGGNAGNMTFIATAGDISQKSTTDSINFFAGGGAGGPGGNGGSGGAANGSIGNGGDGGNAGVSGGGGKGGDVVFRAAGNVILNDKTRILTYGGPGESVGWGGRGGDSNGGVGGAGGRGGLGLPGGDSGKIEVKAAGIELTGLLYSSAQASGSGGEGGQSGASGRGFSLAGGETESGAAGPRAGDISLTATSGDIIVGMIEANGGLGGHGGNGGSSNTSSAGGGNGANGGNGGRGGQAGKVVLFAEHGSIGGPLQIDIHGGEGGYGSQGGVGGDCNCNGAAIGSGGRGGDGGSAGDVGLPGKLILRAQSINGQVAKIDMSGRAGSPAIGAGGGGNIVGTNAQSIGGDGGNSGSGGTGGQGGDVTIVGLGGPVVVSNLNTSGGTGGQNGYAGIGGFAPLEIGSGGFTLNGGKGGNAGKISITAAQQIRLDTLTANGGNGGDAIGYGGSGRIATDAGRAGIGGIGGSISLLSENGDIAGITAPTAAWSIRANGGSGGIIEGPGGIGVKSAGGRGSEGAAGGKGGDIRLTAVGSIINSLSGSSIEANGGEGSKTGLSSTPDGGDALIGIIRTGGLGGSGGVGGQGGIIRLSSIGITGIENILSNGGDGGGGIFKGGGGGTVDKGNGGAGGKGGNSGSGGAGGSIEISVTLGGITNGGTISAEGGSGGIMFDKSTGGRGGDSAISGSGGAGGASGKTGSGGLGGKVELSTSTGAVQLAKVSVSGGDGGDSNAVGGLPGIAGPSGGNGGAGGLFSGTGSGGKGGIISIESNAGAMSISDVVANGGRGGSNLKGVAAAGSDGIAGGAGGNAGPSGHGGNGGTVSFKAPAGAIQISAKGGYAGLSTIGGTGGNGSNSVGGRGGNGGNGGNGGIGGTITLPSALSSFAVVNGGNFSAGLSGGPGGTGSAPGIGGLNGADGKQGQDGKIILIATENSDQAWRPRIRQNKKKPEKAIATNLSEPQQSRSKQQQLLRPVSFIQPHIQLEKRTLPFENIIVSSREHDEHLTVGATKLFVAKGAGALVIASNDGLTVLGLHENATADIAVLVDGQEFYLHAGEQIVVSRNQDKDWNQVRPLPELPIRRQSEHRTKTDTRVLISDFSIISAYDLIPSLKGLRGSESQEHRVLHEKILKNAAIIQAVGLKRGLFKSYSR